MYYKTKRKLSKSLALLFLCAIMLTVFVSCSKAPSDNPSDANSSSKEEVSQNSENAREFLIKNGYELTGLMGKLAGSEEYINFHSGSQSLTELIKSVALEKGTLPDAAIIVTVSEKFKDSLLAELKKLQLFTIPEDQEIRDQILKRAELSLPNLINGGLGGTEWLAATSILTTNDIFAKPDSVKDLSYVLFRYPENIYSMVVFQPNDVGFVTASAYFISPGELFDQIYSGQFDKIVAPLEQKMDLDWSLLEISNLDKAEIEKILAS